MSIGRFKASNENSDKDAFDIVTRSCRNTDHATSYVKIAILFWVSLFALDGNQRKEIGVKFRDGFKKDP